MTRRYESHPWRDRAARATILSAFRQDGRGKMAAAVDLGVRCARAGASASRALLAFVCPQCGDPNCVAGECVSR